MALLSKVNLNDPLMKALKAVNSISGKGVSEEELKKHRSAMEHAAKLATPTGNLSVESFLVGNIECEWVKSDLAHNPSAVILYAHGGGYTCGGLSYARILAAKMALHTGLSVISFAYRLAPEHPYPAALDDAREVWDYLMHLGYGANQVLLAGDSAGGNLVLALTQELAATHRMKPRALLLFSPWTDMTALSESYETYKDKDPILTKDYVLAMRDAYIGTDADPADAKYSPIYGNFTDFPPTLVQVGKNEILQEDSVKLAKRINKAGGRATLEIYKDGWHVFQQMPLPQATKAMRAVGDYVADVLYRS